MRFLLDTHTLIWAFTDADFLSKAASTVLADAEHSFAISAASSWEIATKFRLGKLPKVEKLLTDFEEQMEQAGFIILPITSRQARLAGSLIGSHGDPFDRMLAAQALADDLVLLSNDKQLDAFGVQRLW